MIAVLPSARIEQVKPVQNVDTGKYYDTIAEAIHDPDTQDNQTVKADAGVYFEHIVVNKSVSLLGEDPETTIVDGDYTGTIFEISAANVTLSNFTVRNTGSSGYGIRTYGSNSSIISNNVLDSCHIGIILFQSHKNLISSNVIKRSSTGILLDYSPNNRLIQNNISESSDGLRIEAMSVNNTVEKNHVENCSYGVGLSVFSNSNVLAKNLIYRNRLSALRFDRSTNCLFVDNLFAQNNRVIEVASSLSDNNTFLHNDFLFNAAVMSFIEPLNIWDGGYPIGGNYWHDYNGRDEYSGLFQNETGSDGIGDTPHALGSANMDRYPLFGAFSDFAVTEYDKIQVISNSTISDFQYNGTATMFRAAGQNGTIGFCTVFIPAALISSNIRVLVDNAEILHTLFGTSNSTFNLYFAYTLTRTFVDVRIEEASTGETVFVKADGSIIPTTAPITTADNTTYTFTGDINSPMVIERNNILIDGKNRTLQGSEAADPVGISLNGLKNVTIANTTIRAFDIGIYINSSSNCRLAFNTIVSSIIGIRVDSLSTQNTFESNLVRECTNGIELKYSNYNVFDSNHVRANSRSAVRFENASGNAFLGNILSDNYYAVEILSSDSVNNSFLYNDFLFNTLHVYAVAEAPSLWDSGYPVGGNFWYDYSGTDEYSGIDQDELGADGIGDSPYTIDAARQWFDGYPLVASIMRILKVGMTNGTAHFVCFSTNSTLAGFDFKSQNATLIIDTTIDQGITGFCKAAISKNLLSDAAQGLTVVVNGRVVSYTRKDDSAHISLYFAYPHSLPEESAPIPIVYIAAVLIGLVAFFFVVLRMKKISTFGRDEEENAESKKASR